MILFKEAKILTKKKARQWLKVVDKMIAYYKKGRGDFKYNCPFCKITGRGEDGTIARENCLWEIFDTITCRNYVRKFGFSNASYERYNRSERWVRLPSFVYLAGGGSW